MIVKWREPPTDGPRITIETCWGAVEIEDAADLLEALGDRETAETMRARRMARARERLGDQIIDAFGVVGDSWVGLPD
jgi:hypothetical protein